MFIPFWSFASVIFTLSFLHEARYLDTADFGCRSSSAS
jgi:hypothetical protein